MTKSAVERAKRSRKRGQGYSGNCRMIEIGQPGLPFRLVFNVDHIDSIRFEEAHEEQEGKPVSVGWAVVITVRGNTSSINFPDLEAAIGCYNAILHMIQAVGVPHVFMGPIRLPTPISTTSIQGVDGKVIRDAVDAAELYPEMKNEGEPVMSENDDDMDVDFALTDEDLALLENPELDESIENEIEVQDGIVRPKDS